MRAPEFWQHGLGPWPRILTPLALGFALGAWLRRCLARPFRPEVPVICVGNLDSGGNGKTPVVLALANRLAAEGLHPHVISRGHGGTQAGPLRVDPARHEAAMVGDEPLLLAAAAPTWIARDRARGARQAIAAGAGALILDDGFQNPGLVHDLALVVIDGTAGFGNGRLIPAGPLRERPGPGLARAHGMIVMGKARPGLADEIHTLAPEKPILNARLLPRHGDRLRGQRVIGFAGIGRPEKFRDTLEATGADLLAFHPFDDHQRLSRARLEALIEEAAAAEALLVTTAKDSARLDPGDRRRVQVLEVDAVFDDPGALERLLMPVITARKGLEAAPEAPDPAG